MPRASQTEARIATFVGVLLAVLFLAFAAFLLKIATGRASETPKGRVFVALNDDAGASARANLFELF